MLRRSVKVAHSFTSPQHSNNTISRDIHPNRFRGFLRRPLSMFAVAAAVLIMHPNYGFPIIIRHDVDDAEYLELGKRFKDSICNLNIVPNVPDCMATFVNSQWLITAAHCAEHLTKKLADGEAHQIEFRNDFFEVESAFIHPGYFEDSSVDIALIKLKKKVRNVSSMEVYAGPDEIGQEVFVVGYGDRGNGLDGPKAGDKQMRAGTNKIDEVSAVWLKWRFDGPQHENVTLLEAISGPGDSGSPALIRKGNKYYVAGISSGQSTRATGGKEGLYGVVEYYARVSRYTTWIAETIKNGR